MAAKIFAVQRNKAYHTGNSLVYDVKTFGKRDCFSVLKKRSLLENNSNFCSTSKSKT